MPDARFPAVLPAVSGANLTNLPAGGISNVVEDTSLNTRIKFRRINERNN